MRTLLALVLLADQAAHAQDHYDKWYFGQFMAVDMGTVPPTLLPNGAMSTAEGCAVQSTANGDLLFYTNGVGVWDRVHRQMPNGTDLFGQQSSTQSALVVPDPADTLRYYLFTVPALAGFGGQPYSGLSYSIVDMRANGGFGDVVLKNVPLVPNVTEKLMATRHANGRDAWVVVHTWNTAEYYAYPVTCAGVGTPVVSIAGRVMDDGIPMSGFGTIGCMQFSPAGDRLAATWARYLPDGSGVQSCMDVLRFDNSTGLITDAQGDAHSSTPGNYYGYGVCFSPNGRRLYLSENGGTANAPVHRIMQYDLTSPDPMNSEITVYSNSAMDLGSMQRAPDGSIYIAVHLQPQLARITDPDALGTACNVVPNALVLPGNSALGLPHNWDTHPPQVLPRDPIALQDTTVCNGAPLTLAPIIPLPSDATYLWSTGATTPTITVTASGLYTLEVRVGCFIHTDTATVTVNDLVADLGEDRSLCEGDSALLRVQANGATVLWSNGSADSTYTARTEGIHWVELSDADGCTTRDTLHVALRDCTCPLFLPNAFTPDGDRVNDAWGPVHHCDLVSYELALFDRWGRELFRTQDPDQAWDGEALSANIFNYTLSYSWFDGQMVQQRLDHGHVMVLR